MTPPLYKTENTIKIKFTKSQRKQLEPLLEQAVKNPGTGFVLGQYYGAVAVNFQFVTAEELEEGLEEARRIVKFIKP